MKSNFSRHISNFFAFFLSRKLFFQFNLAMFKISLRGLGFFSGTLRPERNLLKKPSVSLPQNANIFDVGANCGLYSCLCKKVIPNSVVYAFGPHPLAFQKLIENHLDYFFPFAFGLSDQDTETYIFDLADWHGSTFSSLYKDSLVELEHKGTDSYPVKIATIDKVIQDLSISHIHLLKIDVQGHELNVLSGASESIAKKMIDYIQFEIDANNIYSQVFLRDFIKLLDNYKFYRILGDGTWLSIDRYEPYLWEIFVTQTMIAVRNDLS